MIVPMKKIYLVLQRQHSEKALTALRDLAAVHVEHMREPHGHHVVNLREERAKLEKTLETLSAYADQPQNDIPRGEDITQEIIDAIAQQETLQEDMAKHQAMIAQWESWGNFDPEEIEALGELGVHIRFFEIPLKEINALPDDVAVEVIKTRGNVADCAVISRVKKEFSFRETALPPIGLEEMKDQFDKEQKRYAALAERIKACGRYYEHLKRLHAASREELEFEEIKSGAGDAQELVYLKGYIPKDSAEELKKTAALNHWGLLVEDPGEADHVPTLLRNPRWIELIKPLFGMINILPGYKEFDISLLFLIFFSLFFGILIGDAGYGLIFLLFTALAQFKLGKKMKDQGPFILMYVLSVMTILWGVLTGVYFGQKWLSATPVKALVPWLADTDNVQMFCFLLGTIHLSLAHIWRAALRFPSLSFLSQVGWLCLVWVMFFMARMLILSQPLPESIKFLFMTGAALVIFFTTPNWNPLKAMGAGLGEFLLNVINTFTDVVSYIRLFAVGLATVAVADAFNDLALAFGFDNVVAGFITALILVAGHLFNIVLGSMAILVHGLRLNVLEFSGHLGMEWSGHRYNPFKRTK